MMSTVENSIKGMLKTTKPDRKHFPAQNQAHFCWQKYNEYVLCLKKSEGDEEGCFAMRRAALSVCPPEWTEAWDEQRGNGSFLGIQEKESEDHHH